MSRAACLLLALLLPQGAMAATTCRLISGGSVAFGPYDTIGPAPTDTALNLLVRCERDGGPQHVTLTMALGAGAHGASVSARRMLHTGGAGTYLNYGLFRDNGRTANWGMTPMVDAVSQTVAVPNKGAASLNFTIYGRIPPLQNATVGSYADSVQVTVTP